MISEIGICHTFNSINSDRKFKIKEKIEDFVVQEVVNGRKCVIGPIIDLENFMKADKLINGQLDENLSKEERKELYSITNYHPFKRMYTSDGKLLIENNSIDIFVFTILKYNYSNFSLRQLLAKRLEVPHNAIQMGGTKDKCGITIQEISVKCSFEKLFNYALSLFKNQKTNFEELGYNQMIGEINKDIEGVFEKYIEIVAIDAQEEIGIYNIRRGVQKKLGDLDGNYFTIRIRGITKIERSSDKFYNYFGPQRFGIHANNHIIGKKILKKEYDEVIDMIMNEPSSSEKKQSYTQKIIDKMSASGKKSKYIVDNLSRDIRMTYLHAYQSYLFNLSLNQRIENGKPDSATDMVLKDNEFFPATESDSMNEVYLPLQKMDDKLLKGGMRKMIERIENFEKIVEENSVVLKFFLKKSCYATIALREIIGDIEYEENE